LVCQTLIRTGVAGRPEEYFEALRSSGVPRRPEEYFHGVGDRTIFDHLAERSQDFNPTPRSPLWSRTAYDRYLDWVFDAGTTDNGVFGAKLMWGYVEDFVSLLRNIPEFREVPMAEILSEVFPDLTFVRVVRANKIRQAVSLWKAVQTATWRDESSSVNGSDAENIDASYKAFVNEHRPALRFHYGAIKHLLEQLLQQEAAWDAFFEHSRIKPVFILYENFASDIEVSTRNVLEKLEIEAPEDLNLKPRMKSQSDGINDDWARRYSDIRLGAEFDLVPTATATD
jgi:LPS sulfotransferase NodH